MNDTLIYLNLNNTQLTANEGMEISRMLDVNKTLILVDVEKNPLIPHDVVRAIQDKCNRNKAHHMAERKAEWKERKELLYEEENITKIVQAREEEIRNVKDIQTRAQELQLKREQLYVEALKSQEEARIRMEKKIEKEALQRAKGKKKGGMKPKK